MMSLCWKFGRWFSSLDSNCSSVICNWKTYSYTVQWPKELVYSVKLMPLAKGPQRRTPDPVVLKHHVNTQLQHSCFVLIALSSLDVKTPFDHIC